MTADDDCSWWVRPSRVAYSPRMPNRRVSSVFHGMLMVLSGSEESSEEGSRGVFGVFFGGVEIYQGARGASLGL